jgi:hypothetical protein
MVGGKPLSMVNELRLSWSAGVVGGRNGWGLPGDFKEWGRGSGHLRRADLWYSVLPIRGRSLACGLILGRRACR